MRSGIKVALFQYHQSASISGMEYLDGVVIEAKTGEVTSTGGNG
ncbi:MAG: hypothetical protein ACOX6G_05695 [Christensenellales bacterium]